MMQLVLISFPDGTLELGSAANLDGDAPRIACQDGSEPPRGAHVFVVEARHFSLDSRMVERPA
jgi:hypothetical protein